MIKRSIAQRPVDRPEEISRVKRAMVSLPASDQEDTRLRDYELCSFAEVVQPVEKKDEAARKKWIRAIEKLEPIQVDPADSE